MTRSRRKERGEGKIGCIISLLIFVVAGGIAIKLVPVYMHHDDLVTACREAATRAGLVSIEELQKGLVAKALLLELPEAAQPGAVTITRTGDRRSGFCTININYSEKVDFYGLTTYTMDFKKNFTQSYMDAR